MDAFIVLAPALGERRMTLAPEQPVLELRACRERRDERRGKDHATAHLNRWRMRSASPGFTCTFCTWAGKVELRISIVCAPGASSTVRSGGLTPRLLPSTSTSPHGATTSSSFPGWPAAATFAAFFSPERADGLFCSADG